MELTLSHHAVICLTALASADPSRLTDRQLDEAVAGMLALDASHYSIVRSAVTGELPTAQEAARALQGSGLQLSVGGRAFTITGQDLGPLLRALPDAATTTSSSESQSNTSSATARATSTTISNGGDSSTASRTFTQTR